jgi:hypothetical protein
MFWGKKYNLAHKIDAAGAGSMIFMNKIHDS